jgi:hypothetical protein
LLCRQAGSFQIRTQVSSNTVPLASVHRASGWVHMAPRPAGPKLHTPSSSYNVISLLSNRTCKEVMFDLCTFAACMYLHVCFCMHAARIQGLKPSDIKRIA